MKNPEPCELRYSLSYFAMISTVEGLHFLYIPSAVNLPIVNL